MYCLYKQQGARQHRGRWGGLGLRAESGSLLLVTSPGNYEWIAHDNRAIPDASYIK